MIFVRPATVKDAVHVANNLRQEDAEEVAGMGVNLLHLPFSILISDHATTFGQDDDICGIAGVVDHSDGTGYVWMLCTPEAEKRPHSMVRGARRWIKEVEKDYRLLYALTDARNTVHHKLVKFLGFKALRAVPTGPYQLPYLEIVKLCA